MHSDSDYVLTEDWLVERVKGLSVFLSTATSRNRPGSERREIFDIREAEYIAGERQIHGGDDRALSKIYLRKHRHVSQCHRL